MTQSSYEKYSRSFGIDPSFEKFTVENLGIDDSTRAPFEKVINHDTSIKKGIYIFGITGAGKSLIMKTKFNLLFAQKLYDIENKILDERYPFWIETGDYLDSLKPGADSSSARKKQSAMDAHWLFIDDLGASTKTDWAIDQVFQLIDGRLKSGRQTYISSNLSPAELENFYGARIGSRIHELCEIVVLRSVDRRKFPWPKFLGGK